MEFLDKVARAFHRVDKLVCRCSFGRDDIRSWFGAACVSMFRRERRPVVQSGRSKCYRTCWPLWLDPSFALGSLKLRIWACNAARCRNSGQAWSSKISQALQWRFRG